MDRKAKTAIKSLVLELRHTLEDDIAIQLKRYGFAEGRWRALEELPHIERDNKAANNYFRLRAALEQELRRIGVTSEKAKAKQRAEAVGWFVREVAFTHLNRLVALKVLEVRELIPEIITTRPEYGNRARAHYDYRYNHPDDARQPDDALPAAIRHVSRQVYAEFKLLFDVGDPDLDRKPPANAILWPRYPVLKECIALINGLDEAAENEGRTLWAEDEIIGWIYQFYNAEQKEAVRKRGRPRRPMEVAVINQFFTPRWIVKFLVDNTLGRLWLEMHPDSERVRAKCDYLVPEPLAAVGEGEERDRETAIRLDPASPVNSPQAPARREAKRPQEIRLIDPACGTMHFGHYAFEVFQEIYRDARERGWVAGADALPDADIPAAILRHNLYGVDIDLRAVQLAGLSLFIKAKTANPEAHIGHVNLVVADAVLPADGARADFLAQYANNKRVQDAVEQVLAEMENVAEVGSLLRVEERLRDLLAEAGQLAAQELEPHRQRTLPGVDPGPRQMSLAEVQGTDPEQWGAHYTIARLLKDLSDYAAEALQTHDLNAQLFAEEAEKTVYLLDVLLNDYDVAVMNPPFGSIMSTVQNSLKRVYPNSYQNVLCAFVEKGKSLTRKHAGFVGTIIDKSSILRSTYESFREHVLLRNQALLTMADLGWEVLDDANVETVTLVTKSNDCVQEASIRPFFRVLDIETRSKNQRLQTLIDKLWQDKADPDLFFVDLKEFDTFPNRALSYWVPSVIRRLFRDHMSLDPGVATATEGIKPADANAFIRYWWEVPFRSIGGTEAKWALLSNGGAYSPFYRTISQVILYENDGEAIKSHRNEKGQKSSRTTGEEFYFQDGITYGKRTKFLNVQKLEVNQLFTNEGHAIFPHNREDTWSIIAILNSKLLQLCANTICGQHKAVGYVRLLPYVQPAGETLTQLHRDAHDGYLLKSRWDSGNEICINLVSPWIIQAYQGTLLANAEEIMTIRLPANIKSLSILLDHVQAVETSVNTRLQKIQTQIDETIYELYEISQADRALIERELGERPPELVWPQMEGKSDKEKRREHVRRLLSYFLLQALKEKRDGVLSLNPIPGQPTALKEVRRRLETTFSEDAAFQMESDIKAELGRSIGDWLDGPFIKWHTKLYNRRPVIWQLSSSDYHNTFNVFLYIHKMDGDTLRKVQTLYLWPQRRALESELDAARHDQEAGVSGATARIDDAESALEVLADFEKTLLQVIQGEVTDKSPDWAEGPFRDGVYDPVLDDGVQVNIAPLQDAGLLRYKKLV